MPRTSTAAKALNILLAPTTRGRRRPEATWDEEVWKIAKSSDIPIDGAETFIAEQGFLLKCLADEPDLTPLGWQSGLTDAKQRLENYLRIQHLIAANPEIAEEKIEAPIFVVGLPRTATTLAHKILAASDGHRGPRMFEMLHTDLETDPVVLQKRIKALGKLTKTATRLAPSWEVIHPIRPDKPEESMFLLPHGTFPLILRAPMPEYRAWIAERDTTPDYEYLKQALQVLQHGREPKRWILKYPAHLADLDVIRKVFPDATFVWTHRDPTTAIGSLCSLMETAWSMYQRRPDLHAIGELALELLVESVDRGRQSRISLPADAIVDVPYHRLNSDPHSEVPKLYAEIGARWTERDAGRLESVLARPAADRRHEYGVARYSLELGEVELAFGDYMKLVSSLNIGLAGR
ncbi:sulfotransferase [Glycomyces sp. L485]|uniref:sulfotransferase family protein n=1 Tax=Glycomyces sp. L485 TaxID=2909235 RepID=UPI001F4A2637|nr:sulfotransferase [Glycomyces sp. L485]MCH7230521.1 sulfotransferase [Glycomyces sp. L485]